ncbi:transposase [Sporosarcina newyorkensis 2681]|uniref:Transposase n=1 Tax=Sporosarcina newyorkensis 2681 TaxID=1027292 RepID=F9DQ47_9BACL|nr:transposase [Sporosarcina newyorkensis]EGQ27070.1 transposase [Sporosarcina newyorkensis 2681]
MKEAYCKWLLGQDIKRHKRSKKAVRRVLSERRCRRHFSISEGNQNVQKLADRNFDQFYFSLFQWLLEGINNKTQVMKRNAYGFRRFDHFKAKVLANIKY